MAALAKQIYSLQYPSYLPSLGTALLIFSLHHKLHVLASLAARFCHTIRFGQIGYKRKCQVGHGLVPFILPAVWKVNLVAEP